MTSRRAVLSVFASLAASAAAWAFGPVLPSPVMPAGVEAARGLALRLPRGVTQLQLDQNLLTALPEDGEFTLIGFPLSDGRFVDLTLERFDPIAGDAQILIGTQAADGSWLQEPGVVRPEVKSFRGTIAGQPDSIAFLSFAPSSNVGLIVTEANENFSMSDGTVDEAGPLLITDAQALPEDAIQWTRFQCGNAGMAPLSSFAPPPPDAGLPRTGCKLFKMAIDSDVEFYSRFPASPDKATNALTYVSQQVGAFATVYYNQLNVDATLQYLRLWKTKPATGYPYRSDYASNGGMDGFLADVKTRWLNNSSDIAVTRDLVMALSGQDLGGGVANGFGVVCSKTTGYCVAGSLNLSFPYPLVNKSAQNWDCVVFMHEIGHCFGALHTHDTGDDDCFKADYSGIGACTLRAQGTLMSYCHLCPGGLANINFRFSTRNKGATQIGGYLPGYTCMATCGATNSSTVSATSCDAGRVTLAWTGVTGNKGYRIYRDDGTTVPVPMIKEVAVNTTGYVDTTVVTGRTYTYFVRALLMRTDATNGNVIVEGPPSNDARGGTALEAPTGFGAVRDAGTGSITLSWSAVSGASAYQVYRKVGTGTESKIGVDVAATTFVDSTIPANRLATYRVTAGTGTCESPSSATVWAGVGVVDLTATTGTETAGVKLDWTAVTGASSYKVFRIDGSNLSSAPATLVGSPASNTHTDATAVAGKFYTYAVKAVLGSGDSDLGKRAAGWRNGLAPTALAATDGTRSDSVRLTWTAPAGDIADYEVSRSTGGGAPSVISDSGSPPTVTNFTDSTAVPNITYTYTVRARTTAGKTAGVYTAASSSDDGWRGLGPPSAVMASDGEFINQVTVAFAEVPGIASYKVFRGLASAPDSAMTQIGTAYFSPFRDLTCLPGTVYKYGLKSTSSAGDTAMSTTDTGYRSVGAPTTFVGSMGTYTDRVELRWSAVEGATAYRVYRNAAGSSGGSPIVTTTDLNFTDTGGTAGVLYAYSVICDTAAGPGRVANTTGGWRNVAPPTAVTASDGTFTQLVHVSWTPIVATSRYAVYRRIGSQSPQRLTIITGTSYDDRSARPGQLYQYTVRSVVTPGESVDSLPDSGWRYNTSGPNPATPGGGSGSSMPSIPVSDGGGFRGGSSSGLVAAGGGKPSDAGESGGAAPAEDPLMQRIDQADPAWRLDCANASQQEMAAAIEAGSRDSNGDGRPDLCQRERGDLDLNGHVDAGDIVLLLLLVGEEDPPMGDFNHDGRVDRADLAILADLAAETQASDELDASLSAPAGPDAVDAPLPTR